MPKKKTVVDSSHSDAPAAVLLAVKPLTPIISAASALASPTIDLPTSTLDKSAEQTPIALDRVPGAQAGFTNQILGTPAMKDSDLANASAVQGTAADSSVAPSALPTAPVATPGDANSKETPDAQTRDSSKAATAPASSPTVDTTGAATIAAQQAALVAAQISTPPVALPDFSAKSDIQPTAQAATNKVSSVASNGVADSVKGLSPRQAAPALSKSKPVSATSDASGKAGGDKDGDAQATNAPSTSGFATKIAETPVLMNHVVTDPRGAIDPSSLQAISQSTLPVGATHTAQTSLSATSSTEGAAQNSPVSASSDLQGMPSITSAQLTQSMRSSEMKLGMQSAEFGNISISTSLNHQTISAQISIDHAELGRALAIHLPAIEEKLGSAYGVQAKVELRESNNPSSSNDSGYSNSGQQSKEQRQSGYSGSAIAQGTGLEQIAIRTSFAASSVNASGSRLDIRI